jgi:hypothetical protein
MSTIVADATLPAKLAILTEPTEIVDETGRKLGRYIPEPAESEPIVPWDASITHEELDRRMLERGRSWAEIRKRFEQS